MGIADYVASRYKAEGQWVPPANTTDKERVKQFVTRTKEMRLRERVLYEPGDRVVVSLSDGKHTGVVVAVKDIQYDKFTVRVVTVSFDDGKTMRVEASRVTKEKGSAKSKAKDRKHRGGGVHDVRGKPEVRV